MAEAKKPSPVIVGRQFIKKYYERLDSQPETMHRFYQDKSSLLYGEGSSPEEVVTGMVAIKEKLSERSSRNYVLSLENGSVDAQQSKDGGVLLMVTGTITSKAMAQPRQFVQSFFLAEQTSSTTNSASYFVLNDTFRVIDPVAVAAAAPAPKRTPPAAAPPAPTAKPPAPAPAAATNGAAAAPPAAKPAPAPTAKPPAAPEPAATPAPAKAEPPAAAPEAAPPAEAAPAPSEPKKPFSWASMVKDSSSAPAAAPAARPTAKPRASPPAPTAAPAAVAEEPAAAPAPAVAAASTTPSPAPTAAPEEGTAPRGAKGKALSPEEMPSSAIFVKNLETSITDAELKEVFAGFMLEQDRDKMLIAEHYDRGFAFVDLGSQEAVARAVSASRAEGIKAGEKRLVVEPSKKPVRPSGLRAMSDRRTGGAPPKPSGGGKGSRGGKGERRSGGKGEKGAGGGRTP